MLASKAMKALFVAVHEPGRAPAQRYRLEQFFSALRQQGLELTYSTVLSGTEAAILYGARPVYEKAYVAAKTVARRTLDAAVLSLGLLPGRRYDVVVVQREALFLGPPVFEWLSKLVAARFVFDFDDAIWQHQVSANNQRFGWLKNTSKMPKLMAMSDVVLAGNEYLATYARQHAKDVRVIPTVVDTDYYMPRTAPQGGPICIGWSGSFSTIAHLKTRLPALREVKRRYQERVRFLVLGDASFADAELGVQGEAWSEKRELSALQEMDIGLMPLPDDEWSKGKCGLKALLYMSMAIPCVLSPVGVNPSMVGKGGSFLAEHSLADTDAQWVALLCRLIDDASLRRELGAQARQLVDAHYSVRAWSDPLWQAISGSA